MQHTLTYNTQNWRKSKKVFFLYHFISLFAIEAKAGLVMQQRPMTIVNSRVSGKNLNFIFTTRPLWGYSGMQDCTLLSWNELILIYFLAMRASEDIFCVEYNFLDCSARWCWGRQWKRLTTMSPLLLILIFLSEKTRARSFRSLIFHTTCWCAIGIAGGFIRHFHVYQRSTSLRYHREYTRERWNRERSAGEEGKFPIL